MSAENIEDPEDPCNSYQWSVVYCFMMAVAIISWLLTLGLKLSAYRSQAIKISYLDKIAALIGMATLIQFGPMLSTALHSGHNIYSYSQTSCKLMFYTDYGTRHVVTTLAIGLVLLTLYGIDKGFDSVEEKMDQVGLGWISLALFAIQGLFGMVPAMYVDLAANEMSCYWTPSMKLTLSQIMAMEIILRPITPYLLPGLLMIPVIYKLVKLMSSVEDTRLALTVRTVIYLASSYFLFNGPYATNLLIEYGLKLSDTEHNHTALCNLKWFFFLIHQSWFLLAPLLIILGDPAIKFSPVKMWTNKIRKIYDDKVRLI